MILASFWAAPPSHSHCPCRTWSTWLVAWGSCCPCSSRFVRLSQFSTGVRRSRTCWGPSSPPPEAPPPCCCRLTSHLVRTESVIRVYAVNAISSNVSAAFTHWLSPCVFFVFSFFSRNESELLCTAWRADRQEVAKKSHITKKWFCNRQKLSGNCNIWPRSRNVRSNICIFCNVCLQDGERISSPQSLRLVAYIDRTK